jgi:uncharacterized protein (DUF2252 family)
MHKEPTLHSREYVVTQAITAANQELDNASRQRKFSAMSESPYRFFRGTSHLFWADMYHDWRFALFGGVAGSQTWIQGDAHVYNFGAFTSHEGEVIYGLDDFDDALVSDYQYDLWRLVISLELDTREQGQLDACERREGVAALVSAYLTTATRYDAQDLDEEVHFTAETSGKPLKGFLKKVGEKKTREKMLNKWTRHQKNGKRVFDTGKSKLKKLSPQGKKTFLAAFEKYRKTRAEAYGDDFFAVKDVTQRLKAGTGSLGKSRYYVLIEGPGGGENDDIILDVKLQDGPAPLQAMTPNERDAYSQLFINEGVRHATAFKAMAEHPDRYLGWLTLDEGVFSVRERSPFKDDFPTKKLKSAKHLNKMAALWGQILATEHKRGSRALNTGDLFLFEETLSALTANREKDFVGLASAIAKHYADCVEQDYRSFLETLGEVDAAL